MKITVAWFMCACALVSASGCSSNYGKAEEATKQMLSAMDEVSAALESVKDKESAKAAAPKIEAATQRLAEVKKKLDTLKGTKAEQEKLEKEYMPKILAAGKRLEAAALPAALKCEGEPTFLKAAEKMKDLK
jgi:hypothetical protein